LARASGEKEATLRQVLLEERVRCREQLALFLPVTVRSGANTEWLATPRSTNTSGDLAALVGTDGFVELPAEQEEFAAGTRATFRPW
jgi:molybdopterin molybdotransferase